MSNNKDIPIIVTFRHLAPTEALRAHAESKLAGLAGQVPGATDVHVVLEVSPHHHRQSAEITVHADGHHVLQAHEETTRRGLVFEAPRREASTRRRPGS